MRGLPSNMAVKYGFQCYLPKEDSFRARIPLAIGISRLLFQGSSLDDEFARLGTVFGDVAGIAVGLEFGDEGDPNKKLSNYQK